MLTEYKDSLMEDVELPQKIKNLSIRTPTGSSKDDSSSLASTEADSSLADDVSDAKQGLKNWQTATTVPGASELGANEPVFSKETLANASELGANEPVFAKETIATASELEGTVPLVEMDASKPIVELPATEVKKGAVDHTSAVKNPQELPA
jgi:hypothetical protein